jgi:uncharacterized protein with von Willebrand factor type A (vWA) domain
VPFYSAQLSYHGLISERKSALLGANAKAVTLHTKSIFTESQNMTTRLDTFVQASNLHSRKIRTEIDQWQVRELEHLSTQSSGIQDQLSKMSATLQVMTSQEDISNHALDVIQEAIKDAVANISHGYSSWIAEIKKSSEKICEQVEAANGLSSASVRLGFMYIY